MSTHAVQRLVETREGFPISDCTCSVISHKAVTIYIPNFAWVYKLVKRLVRVDSVAGVLNALMVHAMLSCCGAESFAFTFIKQLVDIGDLDASDTSTMFEHVRMLAKLRLNLDLWVRLGEVTNEEVDALHSNAKSKWKVEFKYCHKDVSSHGAIVENCSELLYNLRKAEIKWARGQLDLEISHGEFYHLSNHS